MAAESFENRSAKVVGSSCGVASLGRNIGPRPKQLFSPATVTAVHEPSFACISTVSPERLSKGRAHGVRSPDRADETRRQPPADGRSHVYLQNSARDDLRAAGGRFLRPHTRWRAQQDHCSNYGVAKAEPQG
jgi:hypothetical protein